MKTVVVIPGDGIGPEIMSATLRVLKALNCPLEYEFHKAGECALSEVQSLLPEATLKAIERHRFALKSPLNTPIAGGFSSINVSLRKHFNLYQNMRPVKSFPNTGSRFNNVSFTLFRENVEGLYTGQGQTLSSDGERGEALSIITKKGSQRILKAAFEYARAHGKKSVHVVHKANILKTTSGLFLTTAREMKAEYPDLKIVEMIVDNCAMQLVRYPEQFEVIVTTNLFGDILSDLGAGLVGGLGLAPGANIGDGVFMAEAVHGTAPDIAGKNLANPTALILAAELLLRHMKLTSEADRLAQALLTIYTEGTHLTKDLKGPSGTAEFTDELIRIINR